MKKRELQYKAEWKNIVALEDKLDALYNREEIQGYEMNTEIDERGSKITKARQLTIESKIKKTNG